MSLRQQLARAMDAHTFPRWSKVSAEVMPLIWPLIESALAAARQETAEQIAAKIEAEAERLMKEQDRGDYEDCAALARETGGES